MGDGGGVGVGKWMFGLGCEFGLLLVFFFVKVDYFRGKYMYN